MKSQDPSSHDSSLTDADRDRCARYLFGELNPDEMAEFNQQLASSSVLGEELLQQAELISQLACLPCETTHLPEAPVPTPTPEPALTPEPASRWPFAAALVAIAACIGWALLTMRPDAEDPIDLASVVDVEAVEALLIAKAWADNPVNEDADQDQDSYLQWDEAGELAEDYVSLDDASDIDSALSWISIALAVELNLPAEGVSDDG